MNNKELLEDYLQKYNTGTTMVIGTFTEYRGYIGTIESRDSHKDKLLHCVVLNNDEKRIECSSEDICELYSLFKSCVDSYIDKLNTGNENPLLRKYGLTKGRPYDHCPYNTNNANICDRVCATCKFCPRGGKFVIPDEDIELYKDWNNFLIDFDRNHDYEKLKQAMYEDDGDEERY